MHCFLTGGNGFTLKFQLSKFLVIRRNNKMTHMVINRDYVILSSGNKLAAFSMNASRKDHLMEMPAVGQQNDVDTSVKSTNQKKDNCTEVDYGILCLKLCSCGHHLAACNDKKQLCVWVIDDAAHFQLICARELPRKALAMAFLRNCDEILVADKSGDVYRFDLLTETECKKRELLFGHLSIVLDMVLCLQDRFVVSCDRDEKIRVSCYPNCYNINSYCLGHSEFVIKLGILPGHPDVLISGSGDGTLRFWRLRTGVELGNVQCTRHIPKSLIDRKEPSDNETTCGSLANKTMINNRNNDNKLAIKKFMCNKDNIIAILYYRLPIVGIYEAEVPTTKDLVSCNFLQNLTFSSNPRDVAFDTYNNLWVMESTKEHPLHVYSFKDGTFAPLEDTQITHTAVANRINESSSFFADAQDVPSLIPSLYKQRFDNVSQFLASNEERKNKKKKKKSGIQVSFKKQRTT